MSVALLALLGAVDVRACASSRGDSGGDLVGDAKLCGETKLTAGVGAARTGNCRREAVAMSVDCNGGAARAARRVNTGRFCDGNGCCGFGRRGSGGEAMLRDDDCGGCCGGASFGARADGCGDDGAGDDGVGDVDERLGGGGGGRRPPRGDTGGDIDNGGLCGGTCSPSDNGRFDSPTPLF